MNPLLWAIVLLVGGALLVVLEFLVPSAGIIGALAAACLIAAVVVAFTQSTGLGVLFLGLVLILVPVVLFLMVKIWPYTPIGRRLFLTPARDDEPDIYERAAAELKQLVGREGIAKTPMLPAGIVIVDRKSYDALADGEAIAPGERVIVKAVRMRRLVVRKQTQPAAAPHPSDPADVLSRSLDELGLESIEDWVEQDDPSAPSDDAAR